MEKRKYQIQGYRQNRVAMPQGAVITGVTAFNEDTGLYWVHVETDPTAKQIIRIINADIPQIGKQYIGVCNNVYFWDLGEIPHSNLIPEVVGVYELDITTA